jgi:hypothetical protein
MRKKAPRPNPDESKPVPSGFKIDVTFLTDRSWGAAALVLREISNAEDWRSTHSSFTSWVKAAAAQSGISESSIWRMISAARFYESLGGSYGRVKLPPLAEISTIVTAEQIELVQKLTRVAPKKAIEKILASAVNGSLTRDRLREEWAVYRKEQSKSRRAEGALAIREKTTSERADERLLRQSSAAAMAWISLLNANPKWSGIKSPYRYHATYDPPVRLPIRSDDATTFYQPNYLVIHQGERYGKVEFHIVEMLPMYLAHGEQTARARRIAADALQYADYFWLVLPEAPDESLLVGLPPCIGLISIENDAAVVHRPAEHSRSSGKKSGELAKALLAEVM